MSAAVRGGGLSKARTVSEKEVLIVLTLRNEVGAWFSYYTSVAVRMPLPARNR